MRIPTLRLIVTLAAMLLLQACITLPPFGPSNDRGKVHLEVVQPARRVLTRDEILLLPLSGLVSTGDLSTGLVGDTGMLVQVRDRLTAARENPRLRAVILRIDSPGGTVTASDLIHREIVQFKKETGLPVIALITEVAASGGLYIAMAADEIYALPTALTGSIGVIAMYPNLEGLLGKLGISVEVIKSGEMKDAGSPWRSLSAEERAVFDHLIDEYNELFRRTILDARASKGMTREGLEAIADGRILTPGQALEARLIDGIRYHDEVIDRAMEAAGIRDAAIVSYEYPWHYRGHIYAESGAPQPVAGTSGTTGLLSLDPRALMRELVGTRFLYLWMP